MGRRKRKTRSTSSSHRAPLAAWDELYPTLDLHGDTAETAVRRVGRWLRDKQADGVFVVRIITGRGAHSVGPPVLRGEIDGLLSMLRGTVVSRFSVETGGGAFRIELRHSKRRSEARPAVGPSGAPPPTSLAGLDPDLRRRAEEMLWDLGIHPTPALVRAEALRLQRERKNP